MGTEFACFGCQHWLQGDFCEAFPQGIPRVILDGTNQHRDAVPGDQGLRYTPRAPKKKSPVRRRGL